MNSSLKESVEQSIDVHINAISHNISNLFSGLLHTTRRELEAEGIINGIHDLVRVVVETSHSTGGDEAYYTWDKNDEGALTIIKALKRNLEKHGIDSLKGN